MQKIISNFVLFTIILSVFVVEAQVPISESFGVNTHFTGNLQELNLIKEAGFTVIRQDMIWESVERKKGEIDFNKAGYDAFVEGCNQRNIKILFTLDYNNKLYEKDNGIVTVGGREAFCRFVEEGVKRYSSKNIFWEIWNEPNNSQFWKDAPNNVESYMLLVKEVSGRIKKVNPKTIIVAPATSTIPIPWLEKCFQKGLLEYIDILSIHPYRQKNPETVIKEYEILRELIKKYSPDGKVIPFVSGEWGYPSFSKGITDEMQAEYIVRMNLINLWQNIPFSIWYDWKDDGTEEGNPEHHFGTVKRNLSLKPAYLAMETLSKTFTGYVFETRIETDDKNIYVMCFSNGSNKAYAFWATDGNPVVKLPVVKGLGRLISMMGEVKDVFIDYTTGITLNDSPQYLIISR